MPFDSSKLKVMIVAVLGMLLAIWLGISIATNQIETIIQVVAAAVFIGCIFLGKKIWLLLPFLGSVELSLRIPGNPTTLLLAQMLVLGFCTLLLLMRKLPFRLHFTELEAWILITTLVFFQGYVRNPVGLNVFGGDSVGGRPYAVYAITALSALLLCGLRVPIRELKAIVSVSILGGLINLGVNILGTRIPTIAFYTGGSFVNTGEANYENFGTAVDTTQAGRILWLPTATRNVSLWICSFFSPLKACLHPLLALLILLTVLGAAFSGFRTAVMTVGFTYLIAIIYRGGITSLAVAGFGGIAAVALLAIVNLIHPLPPNTQRALSFLPGTWNEQYTRDASGSTDWRIEIWQEALLSDRWIKNKWLGDGLGFSSHELAAQMNARKGSSAGISGFEAHRETILSNGDYHSTLVSGVRTSGYIGTFILILGTFRLSVHAHRLIRRHRHDEYYPLCLFLGIPLVLASIWIFIGASNFGGVVSSFILGISMIRLLENNLPQPQSMPSTPARAPYPTRDGRSRPLPSNSAAH